jgi:signal transduction histidine kinase/CheY-like chemotaxis protein
LRREAAPTAGDPTLLPDADKAILAEQLRVLYVEGQRLILTGVAAALILVWVLWDHVPQAILLGWLAVFGVYSLARAAMARAWRRRAATDTDHRAWLRRVQWALAIGGGIWAAACFLFYVPDHIEYQLFLVTMLLGAVVSGLVTLAVYLPAYLAFVTPFVAATVIRYGLEGDPLHWGIALAAVVTFFLFINFARFIQNSFVESLRLRMTLAERNRELAERNREVERANLAKSRFLAVASHDLRQPLHALNLFAAQLRDQTDPTERARLVARIDAAIDSMNELFNALLDISKLDAGVLAPDISEFPVGHLLDRIETTFAAAAREKGLRLSVVASRAWVRSDAILLERILLNLVSNAIRYTSRGGIVVGCRRRGDRVRLEVWDSGIGLAEDQYRNVFREFYQVGAPAPGRSAGLGLGLSIVDGLCRLLDHPIDLASRPGAGSRFAVSVPGASARQAPVEAAVTFDAIANPARDKLIVVVDDDALVLDGMRGLLQGWGCRVVAAGSDDAALAGLAAHRGHPNLIISDYLLANGKTGVDVIERMRGVFAAPIPAFLISGDTTSERMRDADARGLPLLHKPVNPMALRSMVNQLLRAAG